ncbi:MAG: MBL fold metallo-hydrolase, partial [Proteobacteria bacterium]|nr:MBL fold metallo-hydrolase [Pseudomonadota bacterium]
MTVSLRFLGAAGGVTGSRTLVETGSLRVLVDCGLFQGPKDIRIKNRQPMEIDGSKVDAVILTHAHLDHSGYLPRFCQEGFSGPIYCSEGTADLLAVMLADAAHLEEEQAKFANKSGYSTHKPAIPLFTAKDVEVCLKLLKPKARHDWNQIASTTSFRFIPSGHIIGASMVQFSFNENNVARLLTFSGDLGHDRMLTLRPPESLIETDTLVLESTYGDRLHPRDNMLEGFAEIIRRTHDRKGVLVIPA